MKLTSLAVIILSTFTVTTLQAAPTFHKVDDMNTTTMQQSASDGMPAGNSTDATNVGAIPPMSVADSGNNNPNTLPGVENDPQPTATAPNMDPQPPSSAMNTVTPPPTGTDMANGRDTDMSADTATGDDDY